MEICIAVLNFWKFHNTVVIARSCYEGVSMHNCTTRRMQRVIAILILVSTFLLYRGASAALGTLVSGNISRVPKYQQITFIDLIRYST